MTLLLDVSRDRSRSWRQAAVRATQAGRLPAADLDGLIREILDFPVRMRRLNNSYADRIRAGELRQPADLNAARQEFADVFDEHRDVLRRFLDLGQRYEIAGHRLGQLTALPAAVADLNALHAEIFTGWTVFDLDAGRLAREADARGETLAPAEVFGEFSRSHNA